MGKNLILVGMAVLLAACGRDPDVVIVGSKNFTENVILGEIVAQHLEARGLPVERRLNLGGTFLCHQALLAGEIDVYPEYSGTALNAILEMPLQYDSAAVLRAVGVAYERDLGARWMAPFGFNDTYAVVVRKEDAAEFGLETISDLRKVMDQWQLGVNFEFIEREDGLKGMLERYELEFSLAPKTMDLNLVLRALRDGRMDVAVENSTSGMIAALDLAVLEDDRGYFPPYDAAAVVNAEALERHGGLGAALAELAGKIDEEAMRQLNAGVDRDQRKVADVAAEWLAGAGL